MSAGITSRGPSCAEAAAENHPLYVGLGIWEGTALKLRAAAILTKVDDTRGADGLRCLLMPTVRRAPDWCSGTLDSVQRTLDRTTVGS